MIRIWTGGKILTDKGDISEWRNCGTFLWWVGEDVDTDDEHAGTLSDRCPKKRPSSSQGIGDKEQEDGTGDNLDNTIDTGSEEASGRSVNTQVLKNLRSVVVDCVRSGHLLTDHESDGDKSTFSVTWDEPHLTLEIHEGSTANHASLVLELLLHILKLHANVRVICWKVAKSCQNMSCLLPVVLLGEEARRLVAQRNTDQHENSWKHLQSQRNLPDSISLAVLEGPIVDPEGHHDTDCNIELVNTGQTTTDGSRSVLRDVEGGQHGGGSDTDTSEESSDVESSDFTRGGGLNDDTENGHRGSAEQRRLERVSTNGKNGT